MYYLWSHKFFGLQGPVLKIGSAIVKFRVTFTTFHVMHAYHRPRNFCVKNFYGYLKPQNFNIRKNYLQWEKQQVWCVKGSLWVAMALFWYFKQRKMGLLTPRDHSRLPFLHGLYRQRIAKWQKRRPVTRSVGRTKSTAWRSSVRLRVGCYACDRIELHVHCTKCTGKCDIALNGASSFVSCCIFIHR